MRGFPVLPALAAALIAGCGLADPDRAADEAAAPAAVTEAASSGPAKAATGKTIPAGLLGIYDASLDDCGRPSDARLTVSPTELRFHESIGTVRTVTRAASDTVVVDADYEGEGERWRSIRELRLGDRGATLTVSGDGTSLTRIRCPAAAL